MANKLEKVKRNKEIKRLLENGKTYIEIGKKYGISKATVGEIARKSKLDPRAVRRNDKIYSLLIKKDKIKKYLSENHTILEARKKFKITGEEVKFFHKNGLNLKLNDRDVINKRRALVNKLFKDGKTVYEIMDLVGTRAPTSIYDDVCYLNNGRLPKRLNTRDKRSKVLSTVIKKLGEKHTLVDIVDILNQRNVTNVIGGKIKYSTVSYHYYKNL